MVIPFFIDSSLQFHCEFRTLTTRHPNGPIFYIIYDLEYINTIHIRQLLYLLCICYSAGLHKMKTYI